jgi:hypothetical protein
VGGQEGLEGRLGGVRSIVEESTEVATASRLGELDVAAEEGMDIDGLVDGKGCGTVTSREDNL